MTHVDVAFLPDPSDPDSDRMDYGTLVNCRLPTQQVRTSSGNVIANELAPQTLDRVNIEQPTLTPEERARLHNFFRVMRAGKTFLLHNPFCWNSTDDSFRPGALVTAFDQPMKNTAVPLYNTTTGAFQPTSLQGDGATQTFQVLRRSQVDTAFEFNVIYKIQDGTQASDWIKTPLPREMLVAVDGVELTSGYSVNRLTGVVTITTPPPLGQDVTCGYYHFIIAKLMEDFVEAAYESVGHQSAPFICEEVPGLRVAA